MTKITLARSATKSTAAIMLGLTLGLAQGCEDNQPDLPAEPNQPDLPAEPNQPDLPAQPNEAEPGQQPTVRDDSVLAEPRETEEPTATAEVEAAEGAEIEGEAQFFSDPDGVRIVLQLEDAPPGAKGVHVHEKGDCSDIKGESMGSHFAPQGDKHALPREEAEGVRHLGDLGNIDIGQDGKGRLEAKVSGANLKSGDAMSFLGKSIVIHSGEDSGKAKQPSGDSGAPMGCGVISES